MDNHNLDSLALEQLGVGLLPDERLEIGLGLDDGLTEDMEQRHATLLLTNRRLLRYSVAAHRANAVSIALEDVDSVEVSRTEKNRQRVWVGLVFIAGGVLLGVVSPIFLSSPISPMLMALSQTLIGVVFMLSYTGGMMGWLIVNAGMKRIKCKLKPSEIGGMTEFVQRFYELKLGYNRESTVSKRSNSPH